MGVIYIGDRATGKTHLALELVNPKGEYVKVANLDYDNLRVQLLDENSQPYATPRQMPYERYLEMEVRLPSGNKQMVVDWIDTAGDVWDRNLQKDSPEQWNQFLPLIRNSEGVLLILPPTGA